ncbi:ABC transporter permease [Aridibaculum aurantiacum]|uniref:ABC transporter permease n=1 Tax=Aridibaculum aurantiacum TaxID=2810307 RepID=UPI001A960B6C|nr:ABC transporter permease [Aridibaculum aurantiacum]
MSKISVVARREFLSRVQKKTFLLSTILLPLIIFGFYAMIIYFSVKTDTALTVAVADRANLFNGAIDDKETEIEFKFIPAETDESLKKKLQTKEYDAIVVIPADATVMNTDAVKILTAKTVSMVTQEKIERRLNNSLEEKRMMAIGINKATMDSIQNRADFNFASIDGEEEKSNVAGIAYGVGMISGFLIYFVLFIYGTMVMRGVMEEKTNRIAEVIISSIKPFQLMMGKIIGIGAVGLVQFIIWGVLVLGLQMLLPLLFPGALDQIASDGAIPAAGMEAGNAKNEMIAGLMAGLKQINILFIFFCFLFYFLGGYFLYSSLFAAVGSAVNEDPQDAQSLMLPITFPIIFGIVIMVKAVNDPNSGLALFGSLFPLTSPIVMMGRLPYGVPAWQLITSFALLIGGFVATTWLAGKIYRTGILMYGKKASWKELLKWAVRKY